MMIEFGALISGLGTSLEIAKTFSTLKGENERAIAVAELTRSIADAQAQLLATMNECFKLTAENQSLKKQLEKDQLFERYNLEEVKYSKGYIFTLNSKYITDEMPKHSICPQCKERGITSRLSQGSHDYYCHDKTCGFTLRHTPLNYSI